MFDDDDDDDSLRASAVEQQAFATDPGELELDFWVYQNCYRDFIAIPFLFAPGIALLVVGFIYTWICVVLGVLLVAFAVWAWLKLTSGNRRQMLYGDTCPVLVL